MNKSPDPIALFSRQQPLLGREGQARLGKSTLMIAGLGGLGCVVAEQLVRLGIGTLYLVDNGTINLPDLNRQILYRKSDIGRKKCETCSDRLNELGLPTRLIPMCETIDSRFSLPENIDGIIDCLDNFDARYILDDLLDKKPIFMVHGAVHGFIGQVTTIIPGRTQSLRRLFAGQQPNTGVIPVSAQIPGIVASIQVKEVISLICEVGQTLINRILWVDLLEYRSELNSLSGELP